MKISRTYLPQDSIYPFKGLNTLDPSTLADPRFSPMCKNVYSDKGIVRKRRGYNALGADLGEGILALPSYEAEGGLLMSFAITDEHQYWYDISNEVWVECYNYEIDDGSSIANWNAEADVSLAVVSGEVEVTVAAGFSTGKLCDRDVWSTKPDLTLANCIALTLTSSINLDAEDLSIKFVTDAETIECLIPALVADVVTRVYITTDLSAMDIVNNWELYLNVNKGAFTLLVDDIMSVCEWTEVEGTWADWVEGTDVNGRYLFITNNIDPVIYWDGTKMSIYVPSTGLDDFDYCRTLTNYLGSLVLGNLTVDGVNYPDTVAYSTPGDFFDYSSVNADIVLLESIRGGIERIKTLGSAVVIYGMSSIGVARFVEGATGYVFDSIITGETRILGGRSVINLGAYHALVMQDNIYLFDGTKNLVPIASYISRTYVKALDMDQLGTAFAFNDTFNKRAYFVLPTSDGHIMFTLDYVDFTLKTLYWSESEFTDEPKCFGFFSEDETLLWSSAKVDVPWSSLVLSWAETKKSPGFPFVVFGSDSRVFSLDRRTHPDNGTDVVGEWESIDFTIPKEYLSANGRWTELEIELSGISASVYYSLDKGTSWILMEDLTLNGIRMKYKLNSFDVVSPHLRIKIRSTSYFSLYWYRLWITEAGV